MKIIFMGNHTVGVIVLQELLKSTEVVGVFAYPDHPDDGTLYLSVKETAQQAGILVYQLNAKQQGQLFSKVKNLAPDLIVVADYKYLLKKEVLDIPRWGAINFHPSLLPKYRGRAPVNWAIINGEKQCGLSVHFIDEGIDTGDIILQQAVEMTFEDTIKDVHEKLFKTYQRLAGQTLQFFKKKQVPRHKQVHSKATVFPRRRPEDGLIDWNQSSMALYNFIRAITYPYPGAFSYYKGDKYLIWQARMLKDRKAEQFEDASAGAICFLDQKGVVVKTGDGAILLTRIQKAGGEMNDSAKVFLEIGKRFLSLEK